MWHLPNQRIVANPGSEVLALLLAPERHFKGSLKYDVSLTIYHFAIRLFFEQEGKNDTQG